MPFSLATAVLICVLPIDFAAASASTLAGAEQPPGRLHECCGHVELVVARFHDGANIGILVDADARGQHPLACSGRLAVCEFRNQRRGVLIDDDGQRLDVAANAAGNRTVIGTTAASSALLGSLDQDLTGAVEDFALAECFLSNAIPGTRIGDIAASILRERAGGHRREQRRNGMDTARCLSHCFLARRFRRRSCAQSTPNSRMNYYYNIVLGSSVPQAARLIGSTNA